MKVRGVKKQPNAKEKHSSTKKKTKAIFAGCCAAALAVAGIGIALWHPWDAGTANNTMAANNAQENDPGQTKNTPSDGNLDDGLPWVAGGNADADYGVDGDGWVITGPSDSAFPDRSVKKRWEAGWHTDSELRSRYGTKYVTEPDTDTRYTAGELIVFLEPGLDGVAAQSIAEGVGGFVGAVRTLGGGEVMVRICFDDDVSLSGKQRLLSTAEGVTGVSRDLAMSAVENVAYQPNDSLEPSQEYLVVSHFEEVWNTVRCESSISIAIMDTGIEASHSDLAANIDFSNSYDAFTDSFMTADSEDPCGHGTNVAGVAAAVADNGEGIAGASFNARIVPYKVIDDQGYCHSYELLASLDRMLNVSDEKPEVVNMSFKSNLPASITAMIRFVDYVTTLHDEFDIVFVATVGNDGAAEELFPASVSPFVGVGSVDSQCVHAPSSQTNSTVDVCAVGENVLTTVVVYNSTVQNLCLRKSGTSLAAPQVAAAALVKKAHPGYSADDIEKAIVETATKVSGMQGANHTDEYGYGVLNAAAAVMWSNMEDSAGSGGSGAGGSGTGGNWSPTAGGSLLDTYREAKEQQAA